MGMQLPPPPPPDSPTPPRGAAATSRRARQRRRTAPAAFAGRLTPRRSRPATRATRRPTSAAWPDSGSGSRAGCSTASCTAWWRPCSSFRRSSSASTRSTAAAASTRTTSRNSQNSSVHPATPTPAPVAAAVALGVIGLLVVLVIYVRALGGARPGGCGSRTSGSCAPTTGCRSGSARRSGARCSPASCRPRCSTSGTSGRRGTTSKQTWQDKIISSYVVLA